MKKTSLEILSEIRSELQELIDKVGELDGRLSSLLETETVAKPEDESTVVEPQAEAEIADVAEIAAGAEIVDVNTAGQGFDIMMDDDIDFVVSAGKLVAAEDETSGEVEAENKDKPKEKEKDKEKPKAASGKKVKKEPAKPDQSRVYAWKKATPASPLSNILSGISLKERGMLISTLFKDDAQLFIDTVSAFNSMKSLNEAEAYIISRFPSWNLDSDNVFRLMMAVRRKLN